MVHANACLTPRGRLKLARCVVEDGWTYARAAERFQCSSATAYKWAKRYREGGQDAMADQSSRPHHSPRQLEQRRERRIIKVRFTRQWGPHRIAAHLRLPRSTVEAVLRRYRMPLLRHLDQASGLPVRQPKARRYEHAAPGDLIHVDIKSLVASPMEAGTASWVVRSATATTQSGAEVTPTCTTRSMTTLGWPTPRSSLMNARRPQQSSGSVPRISSISMTSWSSGS